MIEPNDEKLRAALRSALPPIGDTELKRDLWPQMLRRLEEPAIRVAWFDWALFALAAFLLLLFPKALLGVLYHL